MYYRIAVGGIYERTELDRECTHDFDLTDRTQIIVYRSVQQCMQYNMIYEYTIGNVAVQMRNHLGSGTVGARAATLPRLRLFCM